jgi:hypothetical protein
MKDGDALIDPLDVTTPTRMAFDQTQFREVANGGGNGLPADMQIFRKLPF